MCGLGIMGNGEKYCLSFCLSSIASKLHRRTKALYIVHPGLQDEGLQVTDMNYSMVL